MTLFFIRKSYFRSSITLTNKRKAMDLKKLFSMGYDAVVERGQLLKDTVALEVASFSVKFPWLDAAWLILFQNDIDAADNFPKDDTVVGDQKVKTGDLKAEEALGAAALDLLGIYAKLAWPSDKSRQMVFGQQNWTEAKRNTLKLKEALQRAYKYANDDDYKGPLTAKGMQQGDIDQLQTIANDIETKNNTQELAKGTRPVSTRDRTVLHNAVWTRMETVNTCAQLVWAADDTRRSQYNLYPPGYGNQNNETTQVTVHVTETGSGDNRVGTTVELTNVNLVARQTNAQGNAIFESVAIPTTVNIKITDPTYGISNLTDQPVTQGQGNIIEVTVGP